MSLRQRFWVILFYGWLLLLPAFAWGQPAEVLSRTLAHQPHQRYYLYLPEDFDSTKLYPLFVAVHWYTGSGQQQIEMWHNFTSRDQYILLAPEFHDGYQWLKNEDDRILIQIFNQVAREFPFDWQKVYLVGCSGGAQFVHRFAFRHPEFVRAAAVIAAGGYSIPPMGLTPAPKFFVAVGEKDERRLITEQFAQQLQQQGYDVEFKIYPGIGHACNIDVQESVTEYLQALEKKLK